MAKRCKVERCQGKTWEQSEYCYSHRLMAFGDRMAPDGGLRDVDRPSAMPKGLRSTFDPSRPSMHDLYRFGKK